METKHAQARQDLLALVSELPTGHRLPAERELCEQLGVSRTTLRRALEELRRAGYLDRRHGAGTFVARPTVTQRLVQTFSFSYTEEMRHRGYETSSRVLAGHVQAAGARLAGKLSLSPAQPVLVIRRLRLADGAPMTLELAHLPAERVPGLDPSELERQSLYKLFEERYGLAVWGGRQTIEPTVTDPEESELLGVPLHTPALFVERTMWDRDERTIEYVRSLYRGDRYRFEVELQRVVPWMPDSDR